MSQNIRATACSVCHGISWNVAGSGIATMSDSWMRLKPSIEEPSKPMPSANAPSSSCDVIVNDFRNPRTSVNHRRMNLIPRSSTVLRTYSASFDSPVIAWDLRFGPGPTRVVGPGHTAVTDLLIPCVRWGRTIPRVKSRGFRGRR